MSLFNLKFRLDDLGKTQLDLLEAIKKSDAKYSNIKPPMLSDMIKGKYNYGMGPAVISLANQIVSKWEDEK